MKTKNTINILVTFLLFIKTIFLLLSIFYFVIKNYNLQYDNKNFILLEEKLLYFRKRIEFIFTICMAILIMFIFSPTHNNLIYINKETTILFFLFGFILIVTSDWEVFFKDAKWDNLIQQIFN